MFRRIFLMFLLLLLYVPAYGGEFVPLQPLISVREIKPGMNGYILTVLKGTSPSRIPIKVVSVIPQNPASRIKEAILIRLQGVKLAQGMSGSPVYLGGKLAGAIRSGWDNSNQALALVTPIEDMCAVHDYGNASLREKFTLTSVTVSGMSASTPAMSSLSRKIGVKLAQGISTNSGGQSISNAPLKPGDSLAAMLVWGDVEISAVGTVTATDREGRFIAFGHEMLKRGNVSYPSSGAYIHDIVDSSEFPFKLGSPGPVNGIITQDRDAGIAGRFGHYPPSITGGFVFRDLDSGTERRHNFRAVADEFLSAELLEGVFKGLAEEAWGRTGQGTMSVNIRIDGRNVPNGWARKDIFFSDENVINEAFTQAKSIIGSYLTQPYSEVLPAGFTVTVEATQKPRVLMIEDVEAPEYAGPGEEVEVSVKLRGWRTEPVTRKFTLKIPDDASGVVEIIARGGGDQPFSQVAIEEGLKSIDGLERMLAEFKAVDCNNELIIELNADTADDTISKIKEGKKSGENSKSRNNDTESDFLPEELEYLSETKERRIKEGTLKSYSSEYLIDGLMKRIIHVEE